PSTPSRAVEDQARPRKVRREVLEKTGEVVTAFPEAEFLMLPGAALGVAIFSVTTRLGPT
ncbi:MAG: hypothetical protein OXU20_14690, partial [Myxococcales bacterium]|nr:hypothetical protein [Myxococcales bacterium]